MTWKAPYPRLLGRGEWTQIARSVDRTQAKMSLYRDASLSFANLCPVASVVAAQLR